MLRPAITTRLTSDGTRLELEELLLRLGGLLLELDELRDVNELLLELGELPLEVDELLGLDELLLDLGRLLLDAEDCELLLSEEPRLSFDELDELVSSDEGLLLDDAKRPLELYDDEL